MPNSNPNVEVQSPAIADQPQPLFDFAQQIAMPRLLLLISVSPCSAHNGQSAVSAQLQCA
jgi:hypothetical protein